MPAGMDGAMAAGAAAGSGGSNKGPEQYRGGKGPLQFWLADRDFAVVRFLATGAQGDPNMGVAQVFTAVGDGQDWRPAPGAFDTPDGKYKGRAPDGFALSMRFGIHVYVLKHFHLQQPIGNDNTVRDYAKDWKQVPAPEMIQQWVSMPGAMPAETGTRWLAEDVGYRIWFRGVGFNNAIVQELQMLQSFMRGGNLSSANVIIARKPSPPGKPIPQPTYFMKLIPEGLSDLNAPLTDAQKTDIMKYFNALPPIKEYFEGRMKWPLWEPEAQSAPVPQEYAVVPEPAPVMAAAPVAAPAPAPAPVPAEFEGKSLEEFRL